MISVPARVMEVPVLETPRLRLTALDADALQSWIEGDAVGLLRKTGVFFDAPVETPPLFAEDLPGFRDRMLEAPEELGWWVWLVSRKEDGQAVGVCGLSGVPDEVGSTDLGYAVFPFYEGQGYATESSRRLVEWVLAQSGVGRVRAAVPVSNRASVSVARKLGMSEIGREDRPDVGDVLIFEVSEHA